MSTFDWFTIIPLAMAGFYFLAAGFVLWRRERRQQAAWVMIIYLLVSLIWSLAQAFLRLGWLDFLVEDFARGIALYGLLILAVTLFFLSRAILNVGGRGSAWLVLGVVWIVATITATIVVDVFQLPVLDPLRVGGVEIGRQTVTLVACILGWAVFICAAFWLDFRTLRKPSRHRAMAFYWGIALLLTFLGDVLFFTSYQFPGYQLPGCVIRLVGTWLGVYLILVARLPHAMHLARRSLGYLISTSVIILIFTMGIVVGQLFFQTILGFNLITMGVLMALIFALLFYPLMSGLKREIENWVSGEEKDPSYLLRQYSQSITNILDLKLLATVAVGTASEFLKVNRGSLFLVEREKASDKRTQYELHGVKGMGKTNPRVGALSEDSPLAEFFLETHSPITQSEIEVHSRFQRISTEEQAWLSSMGAELYVPIFAKSEWIGLMVLGPKIGGRSFTNQDIELVSMMANQTAVALENTRLVDGLVRLNNDFRRAYSALDQANRHLERLDRTKSDFISIASHELRTPLTLIRGSSQMLLDDPGLLENPYYQHLLSKIDKGTDRLHQIVDSLLDVAKIDTRALELDAHPIQIQSLIDSVNSELKPDYTGRNLTVELTGLDDLPAVTADAAALRKVFYHLFVNAIKYTPDGGEIKISGRELEPDLEDLPKGGVEIVFSDSGIGIDPSYHELIFVKFYQTGELALHSTGKTKFKGGGPGLGLAIARGVVEAHHGKIWVESPGYDENECPGSKFYVVLPLRQQALEKTSTESEGLDEILK